MNPSDCPKYKKCNAPLCPYDDQWRQSITLDGEAVCYYIRAFHKTFEEDVIVSVKLYDRVEKISRAIAEKQVLGHSYIRKRLLRAATAPSKIAPVAKNAAISKDQNINFPSTLNLGLPGE